MGYCGCKTIKEFGEKSEFIEITAAGVREGHPHEVRIVKEAPDYSHHQTSKLTILANLDDE